LDIAAVVHPFPLSEQGRDALAELGYEYRGEAGIPGREFFRTDPRTRHLHLFTFDSEAFFQHVFFRDYLRAHQEKALEYENLKLELAGQFRTDRESYTNGKDKLVAQLNREARAWHIGTTGFTPVLEVAKIFETYRGEWMISSGWALDAWLGESSRTHHDVDIVVWRDEQTELKRFLLENGWDAQVVVEEGKYKPWLEIDAPLELPISQVHARKRSGDAHDLRSTQFLDLLISERTATNWWWRGDPAITMPLENIRLNSSLGVPILAPEISLFFKARATMREKDELDFGHAFPKLETAQREWLKRSLTQKLEALGLNNHPWLARL
jgi:GrpB protein